MSTIKLHPSLPAPVVHAGFSVSQSKSHVLAGVQDAYWSDDEAEDAECPLCLEEMDISDLNFKPCVCGYQICRFCWHHIKENLNKRCPACRRVYSDDAVEFKAIATQDHKRLTQQKKQRERERKELDALGRRALANVRVVQRNVVYVVGIGPQFAKEELIPTLRSTEYFGQYGKITKILLVKRTPSGGGAPVVGVYITYHRREDAARAIAAVDGTSSPGGGRDVMRASYGTTKYCMAFLRGVSCSDHSCMHLHAWGDEKDCFTKEDLTTLKHTMKATESRSRKKGEEAEGLPRTAAWGKGPTTAASSNSTLATAGTSTRQNRRTSTTRQLRTTAATTQVAAAAVAAATSRPQHDRKGSTSAKTTSSRPATPSLVATPADTKIRVKKDKDKDQPPQSPAPSITADFENDVQDEVPASPVIRSQSTDSIPSVPPGLPAVPPGLSAPPGLPLPRPPRVDTASPQTPLLANATSYQMSNTARALVDDIQARRDVTLPVESTFSPFPDLDRTLQNLGDDIGGFSFSLDPKLAGDDADHIEVLPDFEVEARTPFTGSYIDAFPAMRPPGPFGGPPGLSYPHNPNRAIYDPVATRTKLDTQSTGGSSYMGSFNPFADAGEDTSRTSQASRSIPSDDDTSRKVSRFGFARGRQGSMNSSPLHVSSPLSAATTNIDNGTTRYSPTDVSQSPSQSQWPIHYQQTGSAPSPLAQHAQAQQPYMQTQSRFQPFESGVSEAQLRDFILSSSRDRDQTYNPARNTAAEHQFQAAQQQHQQFTDPAIMAARFAPGQGSHFVQPESNHMNYGPPPGLTFPPGIIPHASLQQGNFEGNGPHVSLIDPIIDPITSPPELSPTEFPALGSVIPSDPSLSEPVTDSVTSVIDTKAQEKAERKAAKKVAAAEKAAERQRVAQERATIKANERAKLALEKAAEKERAAEKAAALKTQQDKEKEQKAQERDRLAKIEKERLEKEKADKDKQRAEKEAAAKKATSVKQADGAKITKRAEAINQQGKTDQTPKGAVVAEPPAQAPLLSRKPKKNKPVAKPPTRVIARYDEHVVDEPVSGQVPTPPEPPRQPQRSTTNSTPNRSRSQSVERNSPTTLAELLDELHLSNAALDLGNHPFFDLNKVNPAAKMPLEYAPLVHALSALSVGGGSFANNVPSGSIDNAVSSFQQLLETLTQTISDLLRLLPRTTWDDSSSFDGVLRDMLKGDDFLDDGGDDNAGKEDEVAALTLALERRARWMEVQLSKLEELHRDINTAAVKAVLAFNDNGWDRHGFMPRVGGTLKRFESLGFVQDDAGVLRAMTSEELEKKFDVAQEAARFAEAEMKESITRMQAVRPFEDDA